MREVLIKTEDLCKSFIIGKTGINVLKNLNIEIYKEDFTVIMGSSGSGKSTLLYSLSTMDNPSSGKVNLLGHEISKINEIEGSKIRNKDISFIFQGINLLPDLTVYENITYAAFCNKKNKKEVQSRANEILKDLELYEDKDKYPAEISGGMQQRV
ncbi:MAG: ABC transporter ATP-binding protein, partial [Clostridium sp.]